MRNLFIALVVAFVARPAVVHAQDASPASAQTYLSFQVDHEVRVKFAVAPQYPGALRGIEGEVLVQFIVDEQGQADMSSFKVLRSTNSAFTEAVRRAVSETKFIPADAQGRKVRQLVQQPFRFAAQS